MSSESIASPQESVLPRSTIIALPWYRVALGLILVLTAILDFFQLDRIGLGNTYYAAAVKSMLTSWHNFFFVSLDPGGFVSVDKPPVAFWIQAASAKVFGFGGISLMLPQALAGVLSVALLYHLVARVFGRPAGLLAALALALTPVAVLVNRGNLIESTLVLALLLAAWAVLRAAETGRLRWLLLSAFLVGVGFNIKMLEAYLALPAIVLVYALGAPVRWWTRLWHLALAGVVLLVVSLSWMTAVDLTPVSQRPYVGSSGNNSELSLALGYNGLGRLTGNAFAFLNGGTSLSKTISNLSPTSLGFTQGEAGGTGIERLVNAELGGQAGWLLMLAIIGFLVTAWQHRVRWPLDRRHQSLVLWGGWLLTAGAFFSIAGFFHAYYLATIAPPVAALAGIGIVSLWQDYRRGGWRGWVLPVALVASALVEAHILSFFPDWSRWLTPLVVGSSVLVAIALLAIHLKWHVNRSIALAAMGLGTLALLLTPSVWTEYTVANAAGGLVPSAGPGGRGFGFGGGPPRSAAGRVFRFPNGAVFVQEFGPPGSGRVGGGQRFGPSGGGPRGDIGTTADKNLVRYLEAHQGHTKFLVATLNAGSAEPFILTTGRPVMALGGFMGDRILTVSQLATDVKNGTVRYFLLSAGDRNGPGNVPKQLRTYLERRGGFGGRFRGGFGNGNNDLVQWVSKNCSVVPASAYHSASGSPAGGFGGGQQLYDCGAYAAAHAGA
jgi:4-amino-4-deoxy-L-arabinose transferase-like glycosyltransferase